MNDLHVVALHYRIEHGPDVVDWSRAGVLNKEEDGFRVRAENGRVRFEFKAHYASEGAARSAVEADYIPNWEFVAGLAQGPNAFTLRFDRSEIVDRNLPPGSPLLRVQLRAGTPTISVKLAPPAPPFFPEPPAPSAIERSPDVMSMYQRYLGHLEGREPLSGMAYFCLTVLEQMQGGRRNAARHFAISNKVLDRIGSLCAKGGAAARKHSGTKTAYTPEEERFLRSAIKTLIHRAAEVESGAHPQRRKITLADV